MKLRTLSIFEFDDYAKTHPLGSYHQTSSYAMMMSEQGYEYDLLGFIDDSGDIKAASLILYKKIGMFNRYGYAPKGFLIDYHDTELLKEFTKALKKYYYKKNFAFIKVNPEISVGTMDYKKKVVHYNKNHIIESTLRGLNFKKLESNKRFETKIPMFNAVQVLKGTTLKSFNKNTRNKIRKGLNNGLTLTKGKRDDLDVVYKFIKNKKNHSIYHYYNYYNAFSRNNDIDILLVSINFEDCLINLRNRYEKELEKNTKAVNKVMINPTPENLKRKLDSDAVLNTIKDNIALATKGLAENRTKVIAGAITIKYKNRVYILISGYDKDYKRFSPNYFLHYQLIEYYKQDYDFIDLNGITGDFSEENPYKGLDEFKLGFNPYTFEYIGEYDFIINDSLYKAMEQNGQLAKEFNKPEKSTNK